eukprot:Nitzschia sp. Nitz4//scaffold32_size149145//64408//65493//NITZ4_002880-RA/size149145-processed-gene-0.124-mRNA-1//-1//CDS//3329548072//4740//frame0
MAVETTAQMEAQEDGRMVNGSPGSPVDNSNVNASDSADANNAGMEASSYSLDALQKTFSMKVWGIPWVITFLSVYSFAIPWMIVDILFRYFLEPQWGAALPGLDRTVLLKVTMRMHMAFGAVCLLIGPFQFMSTIRKSFPVVHRWSGRIYCSSAIMSSISGLSFTCLKGRLVGGWNMTAAFATAGVFFGICAFKAWQTARLAKVSATPDYTSHRNWAIRSYSQVLAPMLYRYWYVCLDIFNLYKVPLPPHSGGQCRLDDICPDYLRILDEMHCWTYWLTAWAVAELLIYYLPTRTISSSVQDSLEEPLLEATEEEPLLPAEPVNDGMPLTEPSKASPAVVNGVGCILALVSLCVAWTIYFG